MDKKLVMESLEKAKASLDRALEDLKELPVIDPDTVAYAAHVLNNYLTVANGTIDLLSLSLKDYPDKKIHTWISGLRQATQLMVHTTSRLMNAACTKKPHLIFQDVNLESLVARICAYYQRIADPKRIQLIYDSDKKLDPVRTDRVAVAAVMDNLLSNAVKYSPPGKVIHTEVIAKNNRVECRITDQGPGLSHVDQRQLFQKGVRLSATPTMGETSSGYGLAIAKDIVRQLGGEIGCQSRLGHGATFYFTLPLNPPEDSTL